MADHQRTCRYGHGPLTDDPHNWMLREFGAPPPANLEFMAGGTVYALRIATCPVCGYVELFDPDAIKL